MKDINYYLNELNKLQICKVNINNLMNKLNKEIEKNNFKIIKKENFEYLKEIEDLENAKIFLENYPNYIKKGVKGLIKNILFSIKVFSIVFPILFIFLVLSNIETKGLCLDMLLSYAKVSLFLSGSLSIFCNFIHPIISNHNRKKEYLEKYQSVEHIEELIQTYSLKNEQIEEEILLLKENVNLDRQRIKELIIKLEQISYIEEDYGLIIESIVEKEFDTIKSERYIYDSSLDNFFKLTLKK